MINDDSVGPGPCPSPKHSIFIVNEQLQQQQQLCLVFLFSACCPADWAVLPSVLIDQPCHTFQLASPRVLEAISRIQQRSILKQAVNPVKGSSAPFTAPSGGLLRAAISTAVWTFRWLLRTEPLHLLIWKHLFDRYVLSLLCSSDAGSREIINGLFRQLQMKEG